jgi:hypothetical protein
MNKVNPGQECVYDIALLASIPVGSEEPTAEEIRKAFIARLDSLSDAELLEAIDVTRYEIFT